MLLLIDAVACELYIRLFHDVQLYQAVVTLVVSIAVDVDEPESHFLIVASTGNDEALVFLVRSVGIEAGSVDVGGVKQRTDEVHSVIFGVVQLI